MKFIQQILLLALVISSGTMYAQLIVNDEFTAKGVEPEGAFSFEEGTTIPNLRFKNLKSETFNLHDKLDKLTLIEFWYTTCKQCVSNKQYIKKFSNQYNLNVISIAVDEKPSTVRTYLAEHDIYWDNIQDSEAFKGYFQKTKGVAKPIYLLVNTDKEIMKVFEQGNIGKLGVFLQKY
jgi:cytochrome oxidase Cu insertion factor (SCO1/SenC/PrrC family)